MGRQISLTAADGHTLDAWRTDPVGPARGGIVVIQEIFGVNEHIRSICSRLSKEGYVAVAPALFDRVERGFERGYSPDDVAAGREFPGKISPDDSLADIDAARAHMAGAGPIGVVGFCLGGSLAFLSATRLSGFAAAVGYYGGRIAATADEVPTCPVQLHFGDRDAGIPLTDVDKIREKRPEIEIFVYPAGHGFNCDARTAYDEAAAMVAWTRTLAFLSRHMA